MRAFPLHSSALFCAFVLGIVCTGCTCGAQRTDDPPLTPPEDTGVSDTGDESSGGCAKASEQKCGAVCIDVSSDKTNCGSCGIACGASAACCASKCVDTAGCDFAVTATSPAGGWENGGDYVTLTGTGFVKGMKVYLGDARAPVRVIDATSAIIQTPPGPVGSADVRISTTGKDAILRKAFKYTDAGLSTPWQQKPMEKVRGEDPGVAVMQDGRVLVSGGTTVPDSAVDALDTAEVYTRSTDKVTPASNKMSIARWHNSAVTLLDGRVLVVGAACLSGCKPGIDPTLADVFNPKTDSFSPTKGKLTVGRVYMRSILLVDGRVLISSENDPNLDIFDPETETFTKLAHPTVHVFGFMVRLRDGRVLLGGGDGSNTAVEAFDPDTSTFTAVGNLNQGRSMLTAHVLPDGRAFVIGGASVSAGGIDLPLDSIEAFNPVTNKWTVLPYKLSVGRTWHASALVRDGTMLVMGGYTKKSCDSLDDTVDQVDPVAGTVKPFAKLPNKNTEWVAVTLLDGSVLGVGGGACGTATALPDLDFLPGMPGPK